MNPLTGDFEAVLQVNGKAVNRLLASIHQNIGVKPKLPSFPHAVMIRVGVPDPVDGMIGTITGQIGCPQIELIHGVSDRFWLDIAVRARYAADPGSVPIPEFIHGTVRAQYKIENIDPSCWGWEKLAHDYLWIRVVRDTVSFTGTAVDDVGITFIGQTVIDPSTADARITALARHLLAKQFEATPHKVSRRFRRGSMRSLHTAPNKSCVAIPIGISGEPSAGNIESINQDLLEKQDVAIAISREYIIRRVQEQLDAMVESFSEKFVLHHRTAADLGQWGDVPLLTVRIEWTVTLKKATAKWIGPPQAMGMPVPGCLVEIALEGKARTQKQIFNFDFDATQLVLVSFDGSNEEFAAAPFGDAEVNFIGVLSPVLEWEAKEDLQKAIADAVEDAAAGMAGELSLAKRKQDLVEQLATMDDGAGVSFKTAAFSSDGVVVRGKMVVSPRRAMDNTFVVTAENNGYSAFSSWIPGGRIDSFNWSWKWFNEKSKTEFSSLTDRYLLRRPAAKGQGKFGLALGVSHPLPGLDGMGQICLRISGIRAHRVTGEPEVVTATRRCKRFGIDLSFPGPDRLFLREWTPGPRDPIGPVAETAIHEVVSVGSHAYGQNALIIRAGDGWSREAAATLRDGLADVRRRDAGLVVMVLFGDGQLMRAEPELIEEIRALSAELEAPLVVNEDVEGSWSKALSMESMDTLEWRLLTPTGGVSWSHSGQLDARTLAGVLDGFLFPSPPAYTHEKFDGVVAGARVPPLAFESDAIGGLARREDPCPPPPFDRLGIESGVAFVKKDSTASEVALRGIESGGKGEQAEQGSAFTIVVLDGGTPEDAGRMKERLPDAVVVPDPDGTIARRFGVQSWPTIIRVDETGMISTPEEEQHD